VLLSAPVLRVSLHGDSGGLLADAHCSTEALCVNYFETRRLFVPKG
jgi:hypothetical protein